MATVSRMSWVIYAKKPFRHSSHVTAYLTGYTQRVGIAKSRIVDRRTPMSPAIRSPPKTNHADRPHNAQIDRSRPAIPRRVDVGLPMGA